MEEKCQKLDSKCTTCLEIAAGQSIQLLQLMLTSNVYHFKTYCPFDQGFVALVPINKGL